MGKEFWLTADDDVSIYTKKWITPKRQPDAIVQLSHGMVEHINRYDEFAQFLRERNIFVYGHDHRGHGQTGLKQGLLGHFADEDGFNKTANDLKLITQTIQADYPCVPIFLIGHSMGTFLLRKHIQTESEAFAGVILLGSAHHTLIGSQAAKLIMKTLPSQEPAEVINNLVFGTYNRKVPNQQTAFDWLTRDRQAVQTYITDPLCGFVPTGRFFHDLMDGLAQIHTEKNNLHIRRDLPLFIVSGDADPVGHYGRGLFRIAHLYNDLGMTNVKAMHFTNARHELLQETNKQTIFLTLFNWIKAQL